MNSVQVVSKYIVTSRFHRRSFASKLLTYCVLRSTQPPILRGMGNEYWLTGYKVKA